MFGAAAGEVGVGWFAVACGEGAGQVFAGDLESLGDFFDGPGSEGLSAELIGGLLNGWEGGLMAAADVVIESSEVVICLGREVGRAGVLLGVCGVDDGL